MLERSLEECAWGHTLQNRIDRGEDHRGALARTQAQFCKGGDALGNDLCIGPDAIVRNRIPCRERHDAQIGGKERQRLLKRIKAAVIARNMKQRARRAGACGIVHQMGDHKCVKPLRHTSNDVIGGNGAVFLNRAHSLSSVIPAGDFPNP